MKTIVTIALLACSIGAQTRFDAGPTVSGATHALGYKGVAFGGTGHLVFRRARLGFEGQGTFSSAKKSQTNDGLQLNGSGALRYYFGRTFVSGGLIVAHQSTRLYSKSGAGPSGGIGWDDGVNTLQGSVDKILDENASLGFTGSYERIVKLSERFFISLRTFATFSQFSTPHETVNRRLSGARAGITIGVGRR